MLRTAGRPADAREPCGASPDGQGTEVGGVTASRFRFGLDEDEMTPQAGGDVDTRTCTYDHVLRTLAVSKPEAPPPLQKLEAH